MRLMSLLDVTVAIDIMSRTGGGGINAAGARLPESIRIGRRTQRTPNRTTSSSTSSTHSHYHSLRYGPGDTCVGRMETADVRGIGNLLVRPLRRSDPGDMGGSGTATWECAAISLPE